MSCNHLIFAVAFIFVYGLSSEAHILVSVHHESIIQHNHAPIAVNTSLDLSQKEIKFALQTASSILKTSTDIIKAFNTVIPYCDIIAKSIDAYLLIKNGPPAESAEEKLINDWGDKLKAEIFHLTNVMEENFKHLEAVQEAHEFNRIALYPAKESMHKIQNAFDTKSSRSKSKLIEKCRRTDPEDLLTALTQHVQRGAFLKQIEASMYAEANFQQLKKIYIETVHQISFVNLLCDQFLNHFQNEKCSHNQYDAMNQMILQIFNRIEADNKARKKLHWNFLEKIVEGVVSKMDKKTNQEIADSIANKLTTMYPVWENFGVGVYGYFKKSRKHESVWHLNVNNKLFKLMENVRNRTIFVYRKKPKHRKGKEKCSPKLLMKDARVCDDFPALSGPYIQASLSIGLEHLSENCQDAMFIGLFMTSLELGLSQTGNNLFASGAMSYTCRKRRGIFTSYDWYQFDVNYIFGW